MGAEKRVETYIMKPVEAAPVKLISGILYSDEACLNQAFLKLEEKFGLIDYRSPLFPFDVSDYYVAEMGSPIFRMFVSFQKLIAPDEIAQIKLDANCIEDQLAIRTHRKVNLDPGYMDTFKVVLASFKEGGQKLYLGRGVWGDMTLQYRKGEWVPFPWTFPDFAGVTYHAVLDEIRQKLKEENKLQHKC